MQPGAKATQLVGIFDEQLKIKISSPPVDGAANIELIQYVSELLGINRRMVEIRSGSTSKRKVLEIKSVPATEVIARVTSTLGASFMVV